jgi:hypothetical protein
VFFCARRGRQFQPLALPPPTLSSFRHSAGNLTPFEAEEFVKALRPIAVADLGSERWMRQHEQLEQLNLQAHHSALSKHDEFVVEALITYEKV